jgi:TonB family protein
MNEWRPPSSTHTMKGRGMTTAHKLPGWSFWTSLGVHALLLGTGAWWIALHAFDRRDAPAPPRQQDEQTIAVELPQVFEGTLIADRVDDTTGEPPVPSGGETIARVDTMHAGRGGSIRGQRATHLADADDGLSRTRDLLDRLDRDQEQRLRTHGPRQSFDDRRTSRDPMELTFLATGMGFVEERRPRASDPSRGALESARPASVRGGEPGSARLPDDDGENAREGASVEGSTRASPGVGIARGAEGRDHRVSADPMKGRPLVDRAPVSIAAAARGRPNDTVDSDQEVALALRSIVHASVSGGNGEDGPGGTSGGGAAGAGGESGAGSHPHPLGIGGGDTFDFNTRDPRLVPYFRLLHARIDPLWRNAFPRSAMVDLKQGTVILEFVVESDGSAKIVWPPRRPSGIDEFDANCADAIRRAAPFPPIPASLGVSRLRIVAPFEARNPVVN